MSFCLICTWPTSTQSPGQQASGDGGRCSQDGPSLLWRVCGQPPLSDILTLCLQAATAQTLLQVRLSLCFSLFISLSLSLSLSLSRSLSLLPISLFHAPLIPGTCMHAACAGMFELLNTCVVKSRHSYRLHNNHPYIPEIPPLVLFLYLSMHSSVSMWKKNMTLPKLTRNLISIALALAD